MKFRQVDTTLDVDNVTGTSTSSVISLDGAECISVIAKVTVNTPAAAAFTADSTTDVLTSTAHGFQTGLTVRLTTTGGLPTGLATSTDYFVIRLTADTYKLATTRANALAGTAIDFSTNGTGTNTATPTALSGAYAQFTVSNDGTTFVARDSQQTITGTGNVLLEFDRPPYKYCNVTFGLTTGMLSADLDVIVKSNRDA